MTETIRHHFATTNVPSQDLYEAYVQVAFLTQRESAGESMHHRRKRIVEAIYDAFEVETKGLVRHGGYVEDFMVGFTVRRRYMRANRIPKTYEDFWKELGVAESVSDFHAKVCAILKECLSS